MKPAAAWLLAIGAAAALGWHVARLTPITTSSGKGASVLSAAACGPVAVAGPHPGMVWVNGGEFVSGSDTGFPEEGPAQRRSVTGFWMDQTEVTNAQFAAFVAATGYRTLAERGVRRTAAKNAPTVAGSAVFRPRADAEAMRELVNWWKFVEGADWRHPQGPGSSIDTRADHPVVHVAHEDALAYAKWAGRELPTEDQFEFAAQGSVRRDASGRFASNTWQGRFPAQDTAADGHAGSAPVACYTANRQGLYDLVGNVWEWTASAYFPRRDSIDRVRHPDGFDPTQPAEQSVAVVKGGSYLCAPDYCMRYRPEARIGQSRGLGTSHIGFRTVLNNER
jgi:formylglycine-generating enzyme